MVVRAAGWALLAFVLGAEGCREAAPSATKKPEKASPIIEPSGASAADASFGAAKPAAVIDAGKREVIAVHFRLLDTTTIVMGTSRPAPRYGPNTEPEISVQNGSAAAEILKVFPCGRGEMERPAFNTCREFKICRALTAEQLVQFQPALPQGTKEVMACARSPKGPAHLLALRVLNDAIVVELSRTDADENSSLQHPLCPKCPAVKLREWSETRRVTLVANATVHVLPPTRASRTVGVDV